MKLDANGVNEFGVAMCECGNKRAHAWESGEWCSPDRIVPAAATQPASAPASHDKEAEG